MSRRSYPWLGVGAAALTLLLLGQQAWQAERAGTALADISRPTATRPAFSRPTSAASDGLPASLVGTQPDGGVRFDAQGRPVTDAELRRYFDWYLAALGEQDLTTIRARLARDLALRANPAQAAAVLGWFDNYVAYQQASTQLAEIADPGQRLEAIGQLRRRMLGEAASAGFFGEEEHEAARVLALRQANRDPHLTPAQRDALQRELEASSPGYAEALNQAALRQQAAELDRTLQAGNASEAERHAERSALFDVETADRFADLDRRRAAWNTRVQAYARQHAALQARTGLSEAQRQSEAARLLAGFTPAEQRRIAGLSEAGQLP